MPGRRYILIMLLAVLTGRVHAEPVAMGLARTDGVPVYADSSFEAAVLDTLRFADYRLVVGINRDGTRVFDRNGWIRVEDDHGTPGWTRYDALAVLTPVPVRIATGDSMFMEPSLDAPFLHAAERPLVSAFTEREYRDGRLWLGKRDEHTDWWLVGRSTIDVEDVYVKFAYHLMENVIQTGTFLNAPPRSDPTAALAVVERLERRTNPEDSLFIEYDPNVNHRNVFGAGAYIALMRSRIFRSRGRFDPAIQALRRIITQFEGQRLRTPRAEVDASLDLAALFLDDLQDTARAAEEYHRIIRDYPAARAPGPMTPWADDQAARRLLDLAGDNPERLSAEGDRIIRESTHTPVKLTAYRGKVRSLGLQNLPGRMTDTVISVLEGYPEDGQTLYMNRIDYRAELVSTAFVILRDRRDFDGVNALLERVRTRFSRDTAGRIATLRLAEWMDRTNGNLDTVRRLYERAAADSLELNIHDRVTRMGVFSRSAESRLSVLQGAGLTEKQVVIDQAAMRRGQAPEDPVLERLQAGMRVRVLYTDRAFFASPALSSGRVKVELEDGRAGWVEGAALAPEAMPVAPLFTTDDMDRPVWTADRGNAANNPVFSGPEIMQPAITAFLDKTASPAKLRFTDVDDDGTLDILAAPSTSSYSLPTPDTESILIDGRTHAVLRRIPVSRSFTPFIAADTLVIAGTPGQPGQDIRAYNLKTGGTVWSVTLESGYFLRPSGFAGRVYVAEAGSLLTALDAGTGRRLWQAKIPIHHGIFDLRMAVNPHAVVLLHGQVGASDPSTGAVVLNVRIRAFDPATGTLLREVEVPDYRLLRDDPVLDEATLYMLLSHPGMPSEILAVDLSDGAVRWRVPAAFTNPRHYLRQILAGVRMVFAAGPDGVIALDKQNGRTVWRNETVRVISPMIAVGDHLYFQAKDERARRAGLTALQKDDGTVIWRLPVDSHNGMAYQSGSLFIEGANGILVLGDSTAVAEKRAPPALFRLLQNYPNPFNARTRIPFTLEKGRHVRLDIYNILGQRVRVLLDAFRYQGSYTVEWDGRNTHGVPVASGLYFYRLEVGQAHRAATRRMLFLK